MAARIPPSGYSQFIPPRDSSGCHFMRHGPPALPPHLLQSVLNSDLPEHVSCMSFFCLEIFLLMYCHWINSLIFDIDCVPFPLPPINSILALLIG